jgi:hypothetical protein
MILAMCAIAYVVVHFKAKVGLVEIGLKAK